jgi:hypothetical protein
MGTTTHFQPEVSVALQGTLDTFALPDVLRLLAATKKTGRLRITGGRGTGSIWVTDGDVTGLEAIHAPHASEPVDALFELLRFQEGAFTFDAEAIQENPERPADVEALLEQSEALLAEWQSIEAVVPSMDAWITLRKKLPAPGLTIDQDRWTTIVSIGAGATVRRIGDDLCLAELPVSRAVKELAEAGLVDIVESAPPTVLFNASSAPPAARPLVAPQPEAPPEAKPSTGPRARRAKGSAAPAEPESFVPLDLPGTGSASSYDSVDEPDHPAGEGDDLAAAFPGLANRSTSTPLSDEEIENEEIAKQLATLSPRAASAIRAAAEATTDEEREAALDAVDDEDQPLNRGLLLKFLSSVKS